MVTLTKEQWTRLYREVSAFAQASTFSKDPKQQWTARDRAQRAGRPWRPRRATGQAADIIVFRVEKSTTRSVAAYLAADLGQPAVLAAIDALPKGDPSASSESLIECLRHGVAFHNADLTREERGVVERAFRARAGGVSVLVATTTIAMGVNTPASTVVIVGLEPPGGAPYSVAEYKNMVGRAGRLGFSETGKAMVVCPYGRLVRI